jgi:hypothetical protein
MVDAVLGGFDGIYTTSAVSHYLTTHLFQLAKTRFSPVVPPLTLDYAAKKIMHAILVRSRVKTSVRSTSLVYLDQS